MTAKLKLSKLMALILRHKAKDYDLHMDSNGFVYLSALYEVLENEFGANFSTEDINNIVSGDKHGKRRYEIMDDKIRAMFGHSNGVVTIGYPTVIPPKQLLHGTSIKVLDSIKQNGLQTQNRQYVHLTTNSQNATRVAKRHYQEIVVLRVNSKEAHKDGIVFHQPEQEHYLCKHMPPNYINFD